MTATINPQRVEALETRPLTLPIQAAAAGDSDALARAEARAANLEIALTSNRAIGMAIGLVMASYHLRQDAAFAVIVRISQESNTKVHVLAERMIANHQAELDSRR